MNEITKTVLIIVLLIAAIIIAPLAIMLVWSWVVPDVFSGAVEQHILSSALSYLQAVKILVLLAILGITGRSTK